MSAPKILVVEDEVLIAEHIKDYLVSFGLKDVVLVHNKDHALQAIDHIGPDLILLDIHLEHPLDGIELAKLIDARIQAPYIFITANADLLIIKKATHTKTAAYITKPVKKSDLYAAVQIALKLADTKEVKFLQVKDSGSVVRIPYADILYIESSGNYINIHTKAQKILSRQSLDWVQEHLPKKQFLKVHRSFIVNTAAVQRFTTRSLFIEESEIPISRMNAASITDSLKEPKI